MVGMLVFLMVFLVICGAGFLLSLGMHRERRRAVARLQELADDDRPVMEKKSVPNLALSTLPKIGGLLLPRSEKQIGDLKKQFLQAGIYHRNAPRFFMGTKLVLMLGFWVLAGVVYAMDLLPLNRAILVGATTSALGLMGPNFWLRGRIQKRQTILRRALPDALDMLVLCLEGGISLVGAIQRVTGELQEVHPELGAEMNIVQREIQLGLTSGTALKNLGERCGLEDVRDLASVVLQSERMGASMAKVLRSHAESGRLERQQRAEELAHKAAVKILFPTLLFIFPVIFVVLLGPAAFQISRLFTK